MSGERVTEIERVDTGVPGFDEIVGGGLPRPSAILLAGNPGTGKTTLAGQIAYYRATRHGERFFYMTLSEPTDQIRLHFRLLGMDLRELEERKLATFQE
ncbi:MAG TPA: AAA family ATPase, partial [Candidatus Korarchaeota archaeon]|nr:AAA family ATPase [Candidatus Korarchaeota archaeon]